MGGSAENDRLPTLGEPQVTVLWPIALAFAKGFLDDNGGVQPRPDVGSIGRNLI